MIINEKFEIKISKKNIEHFKSKGYSKIKLKDIIIINSDELNKGSHLEVKVKCDICSKVKKLSFQKYYKNISNGNYYACSSKCAQSKVKKTSITKFGTEYYTQTSEYKIKTEKTNLKKYGTKYHLQSDIIKEKIKKTNLQKFGVENVFANDSIKEKIKKTNLQKIGVEYPTQSNDIKKKIINNNLEKYGVKNISQLDSIKQKVKNTNIKNFGVSSVFQLQTNITKAIKAKQDNWLIKIKNKNKYVIGADFKRKLLNIQCETRTHNYDIPFKIFYLRDRINTKLCTICNPIGSSKSGLEIQLQDFIKENYKKEILINKRDIITPLELDIYLPELKLAFEFNGLYWHNEEHKPNDYHLNKTELCESKEIQLIHIWEDNWIYKQDIIKSMILNKLGKTPNKIYGRKTEVKKITDNKLIREFLETNHLQGFLGSKIKLGLLFEDELVSLMTFGKRRIAMGKKSTNEGEFELLRFCNKLNTNVLGGASKLFKYFKENYKPKEITTYADRSHSNGSLYKQLGFNFIGKTQPNYYYIIDGIRNHRFNYRKDKLVKEGFDSNKTEHEIMIDRNIFRIYDSGNLKFILETQRIKFSHHLL